MKLTLIGLFFIFSATVFAQATKNDAQIKNDLSFSQTQYESKAGFWKNLKKNTSFSYYAQLLGPSPALPSDQTYNVFTESNSPLQIFHATNLRYALPNNFSTGVTVSGTQNFTAPVDTPNGGRVDNNRSLFNPRVYLGFPGINTKYVTIFNTLAVEIPTSPISRDNEMNYGVVLSQAYSLVMPSSSPWTIGFLNQIARNYFKSNALPALKDCSTCTPFALQTTIISGGPYVNYQLNDHFTLSNMLTFDWDQRGKQTGKMQFNNNLPDRWRSTLNYYPRKSVFYQFGVFVQGLTKPADYTTVFGLDMSIRL